jgi:phage baseplate assembly protein W
MKSPFLGTGWEFPTRPDEGRLAYVAGPDKVQQSIRLILETEPGERVMRPTFGAGLRRFLMQPNSETTRALIRHDVELALTGFEPRIQLRSVEVAPGDDPALVLIRIQYVHASDLRPGNLVYPFYLE